MPKLLAALAVLAMSAPAFAQPPAAAPVWQADRALAPVPTDSFLFVSVKAGKLWDHPAAKPVRDWVAAQKAGPFDELLGLQPADLDRVTLVATAMPMDGGEPLLLVTTRKPYNEAAVLKALGVAVPPRPGRPVETNGAFRWVAFPADRTLLYFPDRRGDAGGADLIARLIARKSDGPLAAALAAAPAHDLIVGLDISQAADIARTILTVGNPFVPPPPGAKNPFAPYLVLLQAKTATLTADFDKTARVTLTMAFPDAATAKRAAPVLEEGMKEAAAYVAKEAGEPGGDPMKKLVFGWGASVLKAGKATAADNLVVATADVPYQDDLAKVVAALPKSLAIARNNARAINNLKEIGIALHSFHDAMGTFPGDVFGNQPKAPAWSWRVQILPYLEQENIYRQLDLTKPWDDPANLKTLEAAEMPKVFEVPGRPAPKGQTYFRVFSYPEKAKGNDRPLFDAGRRGPPINSVTDGLSNTFMVIEAGEAVPWYKPDVLAYDGKLPLPQIGDKEAGLFLALFADGSVRALRPKNLGEQTLRALITRSGGEVVTLPDR